MFEEVFDEEEVARDSLDRFYQQVIQRQLSCAGLGSLQRDTIADALAGRGLNSIF